MSGYIGKIMDGMNRYVRYTNWVWSDGNHPSIVIWDAINENWDSYIGNTLIPELKVEPDPDLGCRLHDIESDGDER